MQYINAVKRDPKSGHILEVKVIPYLERPDIVFQYPVSIPIKSISIKKRKYKTAIQIDGKFQEGDDLIVVDGHLKTHGNDTVLDNLDNLPLFD